MDVAVIVAGWCSVLVFFVGDSAMLFLMPSVAAVLGCSGHSSGWMAGQQQSCRRRVSTSIYACRRHRYRSLRALLQQCVRRHSRPKPLAAASVLLAASPQKYSFTRQARVTSLVDRFVDSFRPAGYHLALAYDDALRSRLCGFRLSHHVMSRVLSHYIDL